MWNSAIIYLILSIICDVKISIADKRDKICQTENGIIGKCIPFSDCFLLHRQINLGKKVITACEYQHSILSVCCPIQSEKIVTPDQQSSYPNVLNIPPTLSQASESVPKSPAADVLPITEATYITTTTLGTTTSVTTVCIPVETTTGLPITTTIKSEPPTTLPATSTTSIITTGTTLQTTTSSSESDNLEPKTENPSTSTVANDAGNVKKDVENIIPDKEMVDAEKKKETTLSPDSKIVSSDVEVLEKNGELLFEKKCDDYYSKKSGKFQVSVIGGTSTNPKEFPHMAALGFGEATDKKWLCGGSLVSEMYVLTAAHCVSPNSVGDVKFVRLGTTNLQNMSSSIQDFNVVNRIKHPNYNGIDQYNDIALLQLDRPVTFSDYVLPICFHSKNDLDQHTLIATGWGKTDQYGSSGSTELQKVSLELFLNAECQNAYKSVPQQSLPQGIVDGTQVCAGSKKEAKDTCQGDSGGPLQFRSKGRLYLVGVTSFGIGCGIVNSPGVYTRVSNYISWVEKTIWNQK